MNTAVVVVGSMIAVFYLSRNFLKTLDRNIAPLAFMMMVGTFYAITDILLVISDMITSGSHAALGLLVKTVVAGLIAVWAYLLPGEEKEQTEAETVLTLMMMTGFFYMFTDILTDLLLFLADILR